MASQNLQLIQNKNYFNTLNGFCSLQSTHPSTHQTFFLRHLHNYFFILNFFHITRKRLYQKNLIVPKFDFQLVPLKACFLIFVYFNQQIHAFALPEYHENASLYYFSLCSHNALRVLSQKTDKNTNFTLCTSKNLHFHGILTMQMHSFAC